MYPLENRLPKMTLDRLYDMNWLKNTRSYGTRSDWLRTSICIVICFARMLVPRAA